MVVIVDVNRGLCSGCPEVPYRLDWTNAQGYYRCYLAWYEYRGTNSSAARLAGLSAVGLNVIVMRIKWT